MFYYEKTTPVIPRPKPMKVLALGLSRTGTYSLYLALKELGLKPYHFWELYLNKNNKHPQLWLDALRAKYEGNGKPPQVEDFDRILWNYDCVSDTPAALFAEELITAYPDAKVILTVRTPGSWLRSMQKTVLTTLTWKSWRLLARFDDDYSASYWPLANLTVKAQAKDHEPPWDSSTYGALLDFYNDHYALVRQMVPKGRLLEYHPSQGWASICEFLDLPVPQTEFPRTNSPKTYVAGNTLIYWIRWLSVLMSVLQPLGTVGFVVWVSWWVSRRLVSVVG